MFTSDEAAFLQSVAERPDDDAPRLVFADWLDEHGESSRAEFIRVQCELAANRLSKKRQQELRLRERDLLNEHRERWCNSIELPLEDVAFSRGLISRVRLFEWKDGRLLDRQFGSRLATAAEVDLSGLGLGDEGVSAFSKSASFPSLRKLILSDNAITDPGASALAAAKGLPALETIYIFGNTLRNSALNAIKNSTTFKLKSLDAGERGDGYCMSPGQADMARRQYLRERILPVVSEYFQKYKHLQSAMLCVAQFWADEADDAVHGQLIVSELLEPTMEGISDHDDAKSDPNIPNTPIKSTYRDKPSSVVSLWEAGAFWDDNMGAIPLWAAFAPEEGSQEYEYIKDVFLPAVVFYRHGGYEILPMARPHLDGVLPQSGFGDELMTNDY